MAIFNIKKYVNLPDMEAIKAVNNNQRKKYAIFFIIKIKQIHKSK